MFDASLVPAVLVFAAVAFGTVSLVLVWEAFRGWLRRRQVLRRLDPVVSEAIDPVTGRSLRRAPAGSSGGVLGRFPGSTEVELLLTQAGLDWAPQTFLLLSLGLALGLGGAVLVLTGSLLLAMIGAACGGPLPYVYVRRKRTLKLRRFEEHLPEAVDLLTRAIRAGHPLSAGIGMVADEAPDVVATEFRQMFEEQRFGLPFEEAIIGLADRIDLVDVRIFVTAVLVQRDVGGNLAETLDNLADTIRARFSIRRQLRVYTAQGRLSGYILGALPIAVALIVLVLNREYMMLLFGTGFGRILVAAAVTMQILGYLWIRRIVNIEI